MRIRTATPDDAAAVAAVHVASWQAAYRGVFPDEVLDGPELPADRLRLWQRLLGPDRPARSATVVAEPRAGGVVGFAHATAGRDEDADDRTAEVNAIYALPAAWDTGAGRALMAAVLEPLPGEGFGQVTLWVLDSNARARRFYERAGFAPDGGRKTEQYAGATITEVRYRRALAASPSARPPAAAAPTPPAGPATALARRAGLTERTFFRHFADKREVLFAGSEELQQLVVDAVEQAPAAAPPLAAVEAGLQAAAAVFDDGRDHARRRQGVIGASAELRERELIKLAALAAALGEALRRRGVAEPAASLTAEAGVGVFKVAFDRWLHDPAGRRFADLVRESSAALRAVASGAG